MARDTCASCREVFYPPVDSLTVTAVDPRAELASHPGSAGRGVWFLIGQYVALTKPRIIELLLITTVPVMVLAERGIPSGWLSLIHI